MTRIWKVAIFIAVFALLAMGANLLGAQQNHPAFTPKDRELIVAYYEHLQGTIAPGTINRTKFPLGVEKALAPGSKLPAQMEKDLELLPKKLESGLSAITGDYARYKLGPHVLLVKKGDLSIADVLKNVALK